MIKSFWKKQQPMIPTEDSHIKPINNRQFNFINETNVNLQQNTKFQFAQKHALSLYSQDAIYSFIPKNGCTTLRTSLAAANGFFNYDKPEEHINWIHNNSYTFSAQLRELVTAKYTFTVLRCPYARLASLFLDKFLDKTPVAWNFYRLSNNSFNLDNISFHDFIIKLQQQSGLINGDIHWRKQSDFLIYKKYDDYFDLDDFDTIKQVLAQKVGLDIVDTRNITQHGREQYKKAKGDYSHMSSQDLKQLKDQGQLPEIDSLFTKDLKSIVRSLYNSDFELRKNTLGRE